MRLSHDDASLESRGSKRRGTGYILLISGAGLPPRRPKTAVAGPSRVEFVTVEDALPTGCRAPEGITGFLQD